MCKLDDTDELFYEDRYLKIKQMVRCPDVPYDTMIAELKATINISGPEKMDEFKLHRLGCKKYILILKYIFFNKILKFFMILILI